MANEFIARKGIIILENGAKITGSSTVVGDITASGDVKAVNFRGSGQFLTDIAADSVQFSNVLNKPTLVSSSAQFITLTDPFTGSFTGSFTGDGSGLTGIAATLNTAGTTGTGTVDLKTQTLTVNGTNGVTTNASGQTITVSIPNGVVSSSGQVDVRQTTGIATIATTGSNTFNGNQIVSGNIIFGSNGQLRVVNDTQNTLIGFYDGTNILGSYFQMWGTNAAGSSEQIGSSEFVYDTRSNPDANFHVASFNGSTWTKKFNVNDRGAQVTGSLEVTAGITGSFKGNGSQITDINFNNISSNLPTIVSSSTQIDVRNTTGIATLATTGSNTFTGIQTISNTTNSTNWTDGALIVQGGVGITKDVNISGSVTIEGLLTVASMSTQFVTSSQYVVGDNRIILNSSDIARFGGMSIIDSGSTAATASIYWDSLNHHFIYENISSAPYGSAIIIAGPKNYGNLGNEEELIPGRVPVATGGDHIDTNPASSSIYIDFTDRKTYIEAGLYVTGAVSSSVGFWGDGSNLTGVVSTLAITGSDGTTTTGTVNLKTQAITFSAGEGVDISVSGQTVSIAGEDASTTNKGVAVFNSSNFTVTSGQVTASAINFNGVNLNLGSSYAFGIQNITPYGASTSDQLTLSGGAIISGILHTSATQTVASPANSVVATISTGSYDAAHFDYVLKSGTNLRTGTVLAVWEAGTSNVEFTDTSTADIGDTLSESFVVDILGANVRLKLTGDSSTWTVKTAIRMI